MRNAWHFLSAGLMLFARGGTASGQEPAVPACYANVEVVSVDPVPRLVVIRNSEGTQETFDLDDGLAGAAGVKAGDRGRGRGAQDAGPGEVRDMRRLNSMDWDGWALPAPDKLEP